MKENGMNRRDTMKALGLGGSAGILGLFGGMSNAHADRRGAGPRTAEAETPQYAKAMKPVTIKSVRAIATAPQGSNLIVVKVETSEPGLYGLGCATFTQRAEVVLVAINTYLNEFCVGRDADNIEDMWHAAYVSSYWRNGPVLNNALSGLDQALWDIKGKRAGMPLYQLLGGKVRFAVPCYTHANGRTPEETIESVKKIQEQGYRYIRIQQGGYGAVGSTTKKPDFKEAGFGGATDNYMDENAYLKAIPILFSTVRKQCGEEVELLHDIHERVQPMANQWFDYIRIHVSQIGGVTPAMKVARLGEWFNVKTAWHGPGDVSPVGHSAHAHIDLAVWNFGIQEAVQFNDKTLEVFSGCPTMKNGYMSVNEVPGIGVDIDEKAAAKFPITTKSNWQVRKFDGTLIRP